MSGLESDLVALDSRQRTSGTVQNATYNLVNLGGLKGTYEVIDYHSNNALYNVETGVNDTLYWTEPGALSAVVPPGMYSQADFYTAAVTVMDAASASTFTFVPDATTGFVTVSIAAGTFAWDWAGNSNRANELVGHTATNPTAAASIVGDLVPNNTLHTHLYISIPQDGTKALTVMNGTEYSFMIPIDSNFGDPIRFKKEEAYTQTLSFGPNNFTIIQIDTYTEDGSVLLNPQEYILVLRKLFD